MGNRIQDRQYRKYRILMADERGMIIAQKNGKYGVINAHNNIIIPS